MKLGDAPQPVYEKTLAGFAPANDLAAEFHRKTKLGSRCTLEGRRPRNLALSNKYWALMTLVYQNQEHYASPEQVSNAFKLATGHFDVVRYKVNGLIIDRHELKSISFPAMDEDEFSAFYDRAITFLISEVVPGLDRQDLEQEVLEWLK